MDKSSKISVVIPLYNKENSIRKTIYSVLQQTYDNIEILVINDGSTDGSLDIIKAIKSDKIRIITQNNSGVSAARNRGIEEAVGDWVVFLDADDFMFPNALSHLYNLVKKANLSIGCANFFILNKDYKIFPYFRSKYNGVTDNINKQMLFDQAFLRMGNSIFSKEILSNMRFNPLFKRYEDLDFFLRVTHNQQVVVSSTPVMVYSYLNGSLASDFSDVTKDYLSHIEFTNTNFWEKIFLLQILIRERKNYKDINLCSFYPSMNSFFKLVNVMDILLSIRKKIFAKMFNI